MEFGKLPNVDHVDWTLPLDSEVSSRYLQSLPRKKNLEFRIGAPLWGSQEWVELIYPKGTKSSEFLYYYSRSFNSIELNTTHYRIPTPEQSRQWISQVPEDFLFCPKVLQAISHEGLLDQVLLKSWWSFLGDLKPRLGPCFIQFPPNFSYQYKGLLHRFLQVWPKEFDLALEFRHPSWFQNGEILPALTEYLQKIGIGLVITDVGGRRDVLHTSISAPYSMLRFVGNNLHPSDFTRAQDWAERIKVWGEQGLQKMFVFVHEPDDPPVIEMSQRMIVELNKIAGANLPALPSYAPVFI